MSDQVDTSRFLSKEEASVRAGVSTKTLEDWNKAGRLAKATRQRDGRGPHQTVYDPDDLDRIITARRGAPPTSLVASGRNGNGHHAPAEPSGGLIRTAADAMPAAEYWRALTEALVTVLGEKSAKSENRASESSENPTLTPEERGAQYVSLADAAATKGVSERLLLRWIRSGALPVEREPRSVWTAEDRGWRIRRKDLEQL